MAEVTPYSPEIADKILDRISEGESLRSICRDDNMPNRGSVLRWVRDDHEGFQRRYNDALNARADFHFDEMMERADGARHLASGDLAPGEAAAKVAAVRLEISTRQWILARMAPKRYGDKIQQEISGPDGVPLKTEETNPNRVTHEEFKRLQRWVHELRGSMPDVEARKAIYANMPDKVCEALNFCEMLANTDAKLLEDGKARGWDVSDLEDRVKNGRGRL